MPLPAPPTFSELLEALELSPLAADRLFDLQLPREYQQCSRVHWTPLIAAFEVGGWLQAAGVRTLLDVGSGPGKLSIAVALASDARVIGLEQRPHLVKVARRLAQRFRLSDRVSFIEGALGEVALPCCDALYFYNPFGENLFGPEAWVDASVELGPWRYARDAGLTEDLLEALPVGTRVITYGGAGSRIPASYTKVRSGHRVPNKLRMWEKTRAHSDRWLSEDV